MQNRTDTVSLEKRSAIMRAVKSRGNRATEAVFVRVLRNIRITGWRRHMKIFGRPDFSFPKNRLAVFVDGCFWHGCRRHCRMPRGNKAYWHRKIAANKTRDRFVAQALRNQGWRVLRIWEHELKPKNETRLRRRIENALRPILPEKR